MNKLLLSIVLLAFTLLPAHTQTLDTLVDIGTHSIHVSVWKGKGTPIVFESGGGNDGTVWNGLIDSLQSKLPTTFISYDRAGYGNSEINPTTDSLEKGLITNTVKDLEKVLEKLGYDEEIIMVAHSYGGFNAALFADRNPDKLKGLVLVDANIGCFFTDKIRADFKRMGTPENLNNLKTQSLGLFYEALAFDQTIELVKQITFPAKLLIVDIVAENQMDRFTDPADAALWTSCHQEFIADHKNRKGITAAGCGHYIFYDDPQLLARSIIDFYHHLEKKEPLLIGNKADLDRIIKNSQQFSAYFMNGNHQKMAEAYTKDGKIFPGRSSVIEGWEKLADYWELKNGRTITFHKATPTEIRVENDIAYDYGVYEGEAKSKDGQLSRFKGNYIIIWKKVEGDWKMYLDIWN